MLQHIAIIMDGNSRWAKANSLPKIEGHRKGAEALRETIKNCIELNIKFLTVYAFSSENWERPEEEVSDIMGLLRFYLKKEIAELNKNNIKILFIGELTKLDGDLQKEIFLAENLTKNNTRLQLNIALSYGSRNEIITAALEANKDLQQGKIQTLDDITFAKYLSTHHSPDPDLIIRTGGDQRLSNFLLWQAAYSELYFTKVLWPDFSMTDLENAKLEFDKRERRYGKRIEATV